FASATVPQHRHFLKQCVRNQWTLAEPQHVRVQASEAMPASLGHFYVVCPADKKMAVLRMLLRRELAGATPLSLPLLLEDGATSEEEQRTADVTVMETRAGGAVVAAAAAATRMVAVPAATTGEGPAIGGGTASGGGGLETGSAAGMLGAEAVPLRRQALVFALPTRPLEAMAAAIDRELRRATGAAGAVGAGLLGSGTGDDVGVAADVPPPMATLAAQQHDLRERQRRQQQRAGGAGGGAADRYSGIGGGYSVDTAAAAAGAAPLAEVLREELGLTGRADALGAFRSGETAVLVATDLAARGLDVPDVSCVVNFDLPADWAAYVHRGGRAGRLGRAGAVVSIVAPGEEFAM
ncbi:unnamed protein product, partial [Phaeothamnion confervicola]